MHAEDEYLFRHAVVRDAVYQMQLPSEREALHRDAFLITESRYGGRPPVPEPLTSLERPPLVPHPTDAVAEVMAVHLLISPITDLGTDEYSKYLSSRQLYLHRAAECAESNYRQADAAYFWRSLADVLEGSPRGVALCREAVQLRAIGRTRSALTSVEESLSLHRLSENRALVGVSLGVLAGMLRETGAIELAEKYYTEALAIHREVGNVRKEASLRTNVGTLFRQTGRLKQAEASYRHALHLSRELGDVSLEGTVLTLIAGLQKLEGRFDLAEETYKDALRLLSEAGDKSFEGLGLGNLANLYRSTKRFDMAEQCYIDALNASRQTNDRSKEGIVLTNYGGLYVELGRHGDARSMLETALEIHREYGDQGFEGATLCDLALCRFTQNPTESISTWLRGIGLLKQVGLEKESTSVVTGMEKFCKSVGVPSFISSDGRPNEGHGS